MLDIHSQHHCEALMTRFLIPVITAIALFSPARSQVAWSESNEGLYGGTIAVFATAPNGNLHAGTSNGMYRYDRGSERWSRVIDAVNVNGIVICDDNTFVVASETGIRRYRFPGAQVERLVAGK